MIDAAAEFLTRHAPADVQETISWLVAAGYELCEHRGDGTFGAHFCFNGPVAVRVLVDRGQWALDIAPRRHDQFIQFDVLLAARSGRGYGECFPDAGQPSIGEPLPEQLPPGISWRNSLPDIVEWVGQSDTSSAIARAQKERFTLMWT